MAYIRTNFGTFGYIGTPDQIKAAAATNLAKYQAGQLLLTTDMHQSGTRFGFDPTDPQTIYALDQYTGDGPPAYSSIAPGVYKTNDASLWPGQISKSDWVKTLSPAQQASLNAPNPVSNNTSAINPIISAAGLSIPTSPTIYGFDQQTVMYAGLGVVGFLFFTILALKR